MSKLVVTNIRFTRDELFEYRELALSEGKSLANYIRSIMQQVNHQKKIGVKVNITHDVKRKRSEEPIWNLKPFNSGVADGAVNHDQYIYEHHDRRKT